MTAICPNGHPNRAGSKFCVVCGARLSTAPPAPIPVAAPIQPPAPTPPPAVVPAAPYAVAPPRGGCRFPFGLIPTLPGVLIVAVAFFMDWLIITSAVGSFFAAPEANMTFSGVKILTSPLASNQGYPSALILIVPGLAFVALLLTLLTAIRIIPLRWLLSGVQLVFALVGVVIMVQVLNTAKATPEQMVRSFGLTGDIATQLANALAQIQPGVGFWGTILGFILIGFGALVDFVTQLVWS
jgi:hypothetical protein